MPEHLYEAVVTSMRTALGTDWGTVEVPGEAVVNRIRKSLQGTADAYVTGAPSRDPGGVHVDVWIDDADLDGDAAHAIVFDILNGLGDQDVLVLCRAYEVDGIRYRFACGTVDAGLLGSIRLVGPYARELARLGRYGSGQAAGFNA